LDKLVVSLITLSKTFVSFSKFKPFCTFAETETKRIQSIKPRFRNRPQTPGTLTNQVTHVLTLFDKVCLWKNW